VEFWAQFLAIPIATGINIAIEDIMATKEKPTFNI